MRTRLAVVVVVGCLSATVVAIPAPAAPGPQTRTATIEIVKAVDDDDPQDFFFAIDAAGFPPFNDVGGLTLDDDADPTLSSIESFSPGPGLWRIREAAVAGWQVASIDCVDPDGGTTVFLEGRSSLIDLDEGEVVRCTFINERVGAKITIIKHTVPNGGEDFSFEFEGSSRESFELDDDADPVLPNILGSCGQPDLPDHGGAH